MSGEQTSIQFPLLFDMSGNAGVFGEDISGEVIDSHFRFTLAANSTQSANFIHAFKQILYTDPSDNVQDGSGVLFYKSHDISDSKTGRLGETVRNLLFDSTVIKHNGTDAEDRYGNYTGYYGIPIGALQHDDLSKNTSNYFDSTFIDNDGEQFHRILIRVAATHLMGHPFAQGFIQEDSVLSDLKACDLSAQLIEHFELNDLSLCTVNTRHADTSGRHVNILQTIYEQLLNRNTVDMSNNSGILGQGGDQSGNVHGVTCPLVFKAGNVVSFYIRPRLFFNMDVAAGVQNMSNAVGNALGISGNSINSDMSGNGGTSLFNQIFSTNTSSTDPSGYLWVAGRTGAHFADTALNQWQTNLKLTGPLSNGQMTNKHAMLDGHIWRIDITLS